MGYVAIKVSYEIGIPKEGWCDKSLTQIFFTAKVDKIRSATYVQKRSDGSLE